jgi:hypothetical protein
LTISDFAYQERGAIWFKMMPNVKAKSSSPKNFGRQPLPSHERG